MQVDRQTKSQRSRFELEQNGEIAWLEFEMDSQGWITLWHTQVPEALRGQGVAGELAKTALEFAREKKLKVDVICPSVAHYIREHPEYKDLVGK